MAKTTRYVNLASPSGGNGTTNGTGAADPNRAYSDWDELETNEAITVDAGDEFECLLTGGTSLEDTSTGAVASWTVNGTLTIKANTGQEATMPADTSRYVKVANPDGFDVAEANTYIEGVQIKISEPTSQVHYAIVRTSPGVIYVDNVLAWSDMTATSNQGVRAIHEVWRARNCVVCNVNWSTLSNSRGIRERSGGDGLDNCLVDWSGNEQSQYAFRSASSATNCVLRGATSAGYYSGMSGDYNSSTVSGDAPVGGGRNNTQSPWYDNSADTAIFEDPANNDFHLKASTIFADGTGADLSGEFTNDFDNRTRPSGGFSLGPTADPEAVAGVATISKVVRQAIKRSSYW